MCKRAVEKDPYRLGYILDQYKTQEMYNETVCIGQDPLKYVPDNLKTQKMCNKATCYNPAAFFFLFLIVLKHKKCAMRQFAWFHTT